MYNNLSFSEPFLESTPQLHILLCLWLQENKLIADGNQTFFIVTLATSIFSTAFGISKFLKSGPCRLVPNEGCLGGYGTLGFILLFLSVTSNLASKGILLGISGIDGLEGIVLPDNSSVARRDGLSKVNAIFSWVGLNIAPQLVYVSKIFYNTLMHYLVKMTVLFTYYASLL